jgi:hypothetical protein
LNGETQSVAETAGMKKGKKEEGRTKKEKVRRAKDFFLLTFPF